MTVDCQWIEKNLEGLFCGTLSPEDNRIAREHIESCATCEKEIAALNAIDPLVKRYFQSELDRAVRRSTISSQAYAKGRLFGLGSAALAAASILLVIGLRTAHQNPVIPPAPVAQQLAAPESVPTVKSPDSGTVERAKPLEGIAGVDSAPADRAQTPAPVSSPNQNTPEFLVSDPAGYSRTLNDYRGHILVIGILNARQPNATSNLELLYKTFGSNPNFRFVGISDDHQTKPANTTFPLTYNQGSRLFGAKAGEFVLLDEMGSIELRGSLTKDFEALRKALTKGTGH
jgi:hypothetical protein